MSCSSLVDYLRGLGCHFSLDELLKNHTTMRVGGPIGVYAEIEHADDLVNLMKFANESSIPTFLIGNGSNILASDDGFDGLIIKLKGDFCKISKKDNGIISCGAGVKLVDACRFALNNSLSGLEFAYGIPGTCGGATYMNAGAYGGEMKDVIVKVECIDCDLNKKIFSNEECKFKYRKSLFAEEKLVITSVDFKLVDSNFEKIDEKMKDLMNRRLSKQPLNFPNVGSIFKRPEGYFVGPMIEQCGLKGYSIGGAEVSEKHAGFIVNRGNALCEDVVKLIEKIKKEVHQKFNVNLEVEPLYLSNDII